MMQEREKVDLKMVLLGAWVRGFRRFAFGTEAAGISSPEHCTHIGSLSTAHWPFQNVDEIGVAPNGWNAIGPGPKHVALVAVEGIKVVWVGHCKQDGTSVWHGAIYPR